MKKLTLHIIPLISTIILFILSTTVALSDPIDGDPGTPCDPDDPSGCPLDTWVIALVIIAVIFTALHLQRKQKSLQA